MLLPLIYGKFAYNPLLQLFHLLLDLVLLDFCAASLGFALFSFSFPVDLLALEISFHVAVLIVDLLQTRGLIAKLDAKTGVGVALVEFPLMEPGELGR